MTLSPSRELHGTSQTAAMAPSISPSNVEDTVSFKRYVLAHLNDEPELFLHLYLQRKATILFKVDGTLFAIDPSHDHVLDQWVQSRSPLAGENLSHY